MSSRIGNSVPFPRRWWGALCGRVISSPPREAEVPFPVFAFILFGQNIHVCRRAPAATDTVGRCMLRLCIKPNSPYLSFFHKYSVVPRELTNPRPSPPPPPPPPPSPPPLLRRRTARTPALSHTLGARTRSREARRSICGSWPGVGPPGFARLAGAGHSLFPWFKTLDSSLFHPASPVF